jgi:hypothetical protein
MKRRWMKRRRMMCRRMMRRPIQNRYASCYIKTSSSNQVNTDDVNESFFYLHGACPYFSVSLSEQLPQLVVDR